MGNILNTYSINYKGLKLGKHHFEFEINDKFFEQYPEGEIGKGSLSVNIELYKQNTMLELNIEIVGSIQVNCDRCLEPFSFPINYNGNLFVKFGHETNIENDELWIIGESEYEINLAQYFYESITLSIPISKFHGMEGTKKSECNKDMLQRIVKKDLQKDSTEIDPRWSKLKGLTEN